ncbi:MAG: glycosyl transferase [Candidatus Melainabacteria bacterium HGW-Melainabacteria-1]|nr:MAG: glycosyl transferase [Candidatus Melainabacteria bacterium HGW-Melainabacteria-1]
MAYFCALNLAYLLLNLIGAFSLQRYMRRISSWRLPGDYGRFEPPVSVLVPAYNEALTIISSLQSVLQLEYHDFEIVVINDGSRDATLEVLMAHFGLIPYPLPGDLPLSTATVRGLYRSPRYPNLSVVDKANGGKADSLNAGINFARHPIVCCLDADSILQRNSLSHAIEPFLDEKNLVCCGGIVRVANGSRIENGLLVEAAISSNWLARFQTIEYLRAFLFGREGWSPLNALLIVSGAFGLFDRSTLIELGGYRVQTIGEDMELTVRLHRKLKQMRRPYRIRFISYPVCWTEVPEDLTTLRIQRIRWQRGLLESLSLNRSLMLNIRGGTVSWLSFPFYVLFEALGPLFEVSAYLFMAIGGILGYISAPTVALFLIVSMGLGILLSVSALLLEELSFRVYPTYRQLFTLVLAAIGENLGYRQLNAWWRLIGTWQWLRGKQSNWGDMKRKGMGVD